MLTSDMRPATILAAGLDPLVEGRAAHVKALVDPWIDEPRPADTVPIQPR